MKWYWKVRIYRDDGGYYYAEIETDQHLSEIDIIQDFYETLTGCKMTLEGMNDASSGISSIAEAFTACWRRQ